ncbi:MAG: lytic transglycosylase domain-containing protein [Acidobacteriota bacterium]|nr:lytic transglycosylase domain-containing protein [Acidobacteriota bacterium]
MPGKVPGLHPPLAAVLALPAAVALAAVLAAADAGTSTVPVVRHPATAGPALPAAAVEDWSLRRLAPAVLAFRGGDLAAAGERLAADPTPRSAVLLGLWAHAAGDFATAIPALQRGAEAGGFFEDWRLFQLSEALAGSGQLDSALEALAILLRDHPGSPLFHDAYRRRLELAYESGDWLTVLRDVEVARQQGLDRELAPQLDDLEWRIATEHDLEAVRQAVARHLLVEHPLEASRLQVVDALRPAIGALEWSAVLTTEQLRRRAANLLAVGIVSGALEALEEIPAAGRDLEWTFLRAEALTADRRGAAALELLAERPATPVDRLPDLWRLRSAAALEAATVRADRANADASRRQEWRTRAWDDLWRLAERGDVPSRLAALRRIYSLASPEDDLELALDILRRLRALDPADVTAYGDLWKLGWREFARDNTTGAIGIWRALLDLYPETTTARQALYWSAVAHERLGNHDRGRDLLAAVTDSDSVDFYARHAARRLGRTARRAPARSPTEAWPDDPALARAALLSELGLDRPAARELDLLRGRADERAADGLAALILARMGERRDSIQAIWRAFRVLGKPGQTRVPENVRHLYYPLDYPDIVQRWAERRELPPFLVYGIIRQESAFDAGALSRAGARGLMQLMPATGRELAAKLRLPYSLDRLVDPEYSVQLGTRYFAEVLAMFDGDVELALAGYNGGPYRLKRWWREAGPDAEVDRFLEGLALTETTSYVKRILIFEDSYRQLYGAEG